MYAERYGQIIGKIKKPTTTPTVDEKITNESILNSDILLTLYKKCTSKGYMYISSFKPFSEEEIKTANELKQFYGAINTYARENNIGPHNPEITGYNIEYGKISCGTGITDNIVFFSQLPIELGDDFIKLDDVITYFNNKLENSDQKTAIKKLHNV